MEKMLFNSKMMKEAHKMAKELKEKYSDINYHYQLGLCIKYLLKEEKLNKMIGLEEYFKDMEQNPGYYSYIFYNNNIIVKNGRLSEDLKRDCKVSANYRIQYGEEEDIKNSVIVKIIEYFNKHKTLKYRYRGTLYGQLLANVLRGHARHLARFRSYQDEKYLNIGYSGDSTTILHEDDKTSIFKLDLLNVLTDRQLEIISLLEEGYTKVETASILSISRQAVHKNINSIKKIMIENGLAKGY